MVLFLDEGEHGEHGEHANITTLACYMINRFFLLNFQVNLPLKFEPCDSLNAGQGL